MPVSPRASPRASTSHRVEGGTRANHTTELRAKTFYETTSVQDRIRRWQAQGAAHALAPDAVSALSVPFSSRERSKSRSQSPVEETARSTPRRRSRRSPAVPESPTPGEQARSRSAPRKRVVSDEHWKARKGDQQAQTYSKIDPKTVGPPQHDLSYTETSKHEAREERRARRRKTRLSRDSQRESPSAYQDPIEKTFGAHNDINAYIDDELAQLAASSEDGYTADAPSHRSFSIDDDMSTPVATSRYADTLGRAGRDPGVSRSRPKGARLFSKTRDMFGRYESMPVGSNRIPSIEAWLDDQPDPFVDAGTEEAFLPEAVVPQPLKKSSRRKRRTTSRRRVSDPNKIWDTVTTRRDSPASDEKGSPAEQDDAKLGMAYDHSGAQPEPSQDQAVCSDESPNTLKRRGARNRRTMKPQTPPHRTAMRDNSPVADPPVAATSPTEHPQRTCPPTGAHKLSTIASIETFKEQKDPPPYEATVPGESCSLKRRLTTHEDLMSVLSFPVHRRSTASRRNARNPASQSAAAVLEDLIATEEKYGRELRTLVDGVIPVLLQCVLSKSDAVSAACLFTSNNNDKDGANVTRPIIDMGISLERLKSLHNRIPMQNIDSLLAWAQNAQRTYNDYLKAWRMGFQDIVVNLAPLGGQQQQVNDGMSRDAGGDLIDAEGKKADVAYLLKRPLVRVKNLAKTFEAIAQHSQKPVALEVARAFADLTALARRRHQEEQARLEDEAAAAIDTTKCRDIRSLGPTASVTLDPSKKVRARDPFNLTIYHTTGQRMDCRIEMIFRDNSSSSHNNGDVMICEIDASGRWLLFPPVELSSISARRGEDGFDLVVMVRGRAGINQEWQELLALKSDSAEATSEWMAMLGSSPLPPKLNRTSSFRSSSPVRGGKQHQRPMSADSQEQLEEALPNDIPIGEPSVLGMSEVSSIPPKARKPLLERFVPRLNLGGGLQAKPIQPPAHVEPRRTRHPAPSTHSSDRPTVSDLSLKDLPQIPKASSAPSTPSNVSSRLRPSSAAGKGADPGEYMMSGALNSPSKVREQMAEAVASKDRQKSEAPPKELPAAPMAKEFKSETRLSMPNLKKESGSGRPGLERVVSATPTSELPTIVKVRGNAGQVSAPSSTPLNDSIRDQWMSLSDQGASPQNRQTNAKKKGQIFTEDLPIPPAPTVRRESPPKSARPKTPERAPAPPPHREMSAGYVDPTGKLDIKAGPKAPAARADGQVKRKSSSPLKHEYAPSTGSESESGSGSEDMSDSSSETSEDYMSEMKDMHTPLVPVAARNRRTSKSNHPPLTSPPTTGTGTLAPSDSASQGPYRSVPPSTSVPSNRKGKTIALVCSWSDKGMWEQIYPDECSIVVSPGLIEAFEMSAAHSGDRKNREHTSEETDSRSASLTSQPLVAFELTPIVPLRRGTALDINIRSPPTANSKLKTTNNIMFRSRNADECDTLYGMINWARCNNPTYIQLQMARPRQPPVTFNVGQAQHSRARSSSWFSFGGSQKHSSYRASSAPTPAAMSVGGDSEATTGTMSSAFSALKRLSVSSAFSLNRSSVMRKNGGFSRTSGSLYSSSSGGGAGSGSGSSTPIPSQLGLVPGKDGPNVPGTSAEAVNGGGMVNNMKIRLYARKGQHWENLGPGRLSVLPALEMSSNPDASGQKPELSPPPTATPSRHASTTHVVGEPGQHKGPRLPSANHTPHRVHGNGREKRIVIRNKKKNEFILLDAILGESCFERVMQTGIAVKVWTEDEAIGETGGVVMGREKIYMMQFPGVREAGWVFGLVGSYRYGTGSGD